MTVFVSAKQDEGNLFEAELEPIILEEQGLRDLGVGRQELEQLYVVVHLLEKPFYAKEYFASKAVKLWFLST